MINVMALMAAAESSNIQLNCAITKINDSKYIIIYKEGGYWRGRIITIENDCLTTGGKEVILKEEKND